jgi:hypothetical protein
MNSAKLAPGGSQLAINWGASQIFAMLGYTNASSLISVDGVTSATLPPQLDVQGTYVEVYVDCISSARTVNGSPSNCICRIPVMASAGNETVFPSGSTGMISPIYPANISSYVSSYTVSFKNKNGTDTVFMSGNAILQLDIMNI